MVVEVRKSKKTVSVALVRDAVAALSERNGSSIKSIFNYLVWSRQANSGAHKQVVLAIRKAVKTGVLVRKSGKGFVVSRKQLASKSGKRSSKRKTKKRAARKASQKSSRARGHRRGQKKRKARKSSKRRKSSKKIKRSSAKVARKRAPSQKRKDNRKPKSANYARPLPIMSARHRRKCTIGIKYSA